MHRNKRAQWDKVEVPDCADGECPYRGKARVEGRSLVIVLPFMNKETAESALTMFLRDDEED